MIRKLLLVACWLFCAAHGSAKTAVEHIADGRAYLAATNILAANASFANAVALEPHNQTANAFYATTRLLSWPYQPVGSNFLTRLGVPRNGRDIYKWMAWFPSDTNRVWIAPAGVSAAEITSVMRTNLLPLLVAADAHLATITSTNFSVNLTAAETRGLAVTVDFGDIQMLRSMLQAGQLCIYTLYSWNLNAQLTALRSHFVSGSFQSALAAFPNLLTFATTNDANAARSVFQSAAARYLHASQIIRSRSHLIRLFNLDPWQVDEEEEFRITLIALTNSLSGPVALPTHPLTSIDMGMYFRQIRSPRSWLPAFSSDAFVAGTLPDPTFGGVVGGMNRTAVERTLMGIPGVAAVLRAPGVAMTVFPQTIDANGVTLARNGYFYGTAYSGGINGQGSVFRMTTNGSVTTIASFNTTIGAYPVGQLMEASDGRLYGFSSSGYGSIFRVTTNGALSRVATFDSSSGYSPRGQLIEGADGQFYGVAQYGGWNGVGSIFKVSSAGVLTVIAYFNTTRGQYPTSLMKAPDGAFYGTTSGGAANNNGGVFRVTTNGVFTLLASFPTGASSYDASPLVQGQDGFLYGTLPYGGANYNGMLYKVSRSGGMSVVVSFGSDEIYQGSNPVQLVVGDGGAIYGLTTWGGGSDNGSVFKLLPNGTIVPVCWLDPEVHYPANLTRAANGTFYGTVHDTSHRNKVFQLRLPNVAGFIAQPENQTVVAGSPAAFTVIPAGSGPWQFQWRKNGLPLSGATHSNYPVPNAQPGQAGQYSVMVSSSAGSVLSSNASLTVLVRPLITLQPASQSIQAGTTLRLSSAATGSSLLLYQWSRNGFAIPGATQPVFTVPNAQRIHSGAYSVAVSNPAGTARSFNANVTVLGPPEIVTPPLNIITTAGQPVTLTVVARGLAPLSYQWSFKGTPITGATGSSYSMTNVQPRHTGNYSVSVFNPLGHISTNASVEVRVIVTTTVWGTGSVTVAPGLVVTSGSSQLKVVPPGSNVYFSAAPGADQTISEWHLDNRLRQTGGTAYVLSNVQTNHTVKAIFRPIAKLYFQHTNGAQMEWWLNGTNFLRNFLLPSIPAAWQMAGQTDFNFDGDMDFLYQNAENQLFVRTMSGASVGREDLVNSGQAAPAGWRAAALLDVGGATHRDIIFQTSSNRLTSWIMGFGTNVLGSSLLPFHSAGWRAAGTGDFNADHARDILWQDSSGRVAVWLMSGPTRTATTFLRNGEPAASGLLVSAVTDLDYNGQPDIVLQNSSGQVLVWLMDRTNYVGTVLLRNGQTNAAGWRVVGPK